MHVTVANHLRTSHLSRIIIILIFQVWTSENGRSLMTSRGTVKTMHARDHVFTRIPDLYLTTTLCHPTGAIGTIGTPRPIQLRPLWLGRIMDAAMVFFTRSYLLGSFRQVRKWFSNLTLNTTVNVCIAATSLVCHLECVWTLNCLIVRNITSFHRTHS